MESTSQLIRCQPFSDYPTESQQTCCSKMNLLPAVNNPLHCKTCHIRKIVPKEWHQFFLPIIVQMNIFQIIIPLSVYYVPRLHFKQFGQSNLLIHMSLSAYKDYHWCIKTICLHKLLQNIMVQVKDVNIQHTFKVQKGILFILQLYNII